MGQLYLVPPDKGRSFLGLVDEVKMDKWAVSRQPESPIIETGCGKVSHRKARRFFLHF